MLHYSLVSLGVVYRRSHPIATQFPAKNRDSQPIPLNTSKIVTCRGQRDKIHTSATHNAMRVINMIRRLTIRLALFSRAYYVSSDTQLTNATCLDYVLAYRAPARDPHTPMNRQAYKPSDLSRSPTSHSIRNTT